MKLFTVIPVVWSIFLFLCASQDDANNPDVCQEAKLINNLECLELCPTCETDDIDEEYSISCTLSPTNILNCSWLLHTLDKDIAIFISVCDHKRTIHPMSLISEESVGSSFMELQEYEMLEVVLQINVSLNNEAAVYRYVYDTQKMAVPSPPESISASWKNGELMVTWGLPQTRTLINHQCFQYQLDIGDQEEPRELSSNESFIKNADPTIGYLVRVRAAIDHNTCTGPRQWSNWSQTVKVQPSLPELNIPLIISISLGIPMILLALLLFVRHQRIFEVLFPPIPRPPLKYKHFLEKNDTFNFNYPATPVNSEEEITEVEDANQSPEKET